MEEEESNETIPQKLAKTDPKKVLGAGGIVLVILILLVYLIVRRSGKKRVSGEKEEAEKKWKKRTKRKNFLSDFLAILVMAVMLIGSMAQAVLQMIM